MSNAAERLGSIKTRKCPFYIENNKASIFVYWINIY